LASLLDGKLLAAMPSSSLSAVQGRSIDPLTKGLNASKDLSLPEKRKRGVLRTLFETLGDPNRCPDGWSAYISGHSQGGAFATMATLTVARQTRFRSPVPYSFAAPRAGDPQFAISRGIVKFLLQWSAALLDLQCTFPGPPQARPSPNRDIALQNRIAKMAFAQDTKSLSNATVDMFYLGQLL